VRRLPTAERGVFAQAHPDAESPMIRFDGDVANIYGLGFRRRPGTGPAGTHR
jgi:hypothetical protein